VIALLTGEAFSKFDPEHLVGAWISAVNLSGVLTKLCSAGHADDEADAAINALDLQIAPFDQAQARATARLWRKTKSARLSLTDRACLALGRHLGARVITADRARGRVDVGAEIVLIH